MVIMYAVRSFSVKIGFSLSCKECESTVQNSHFNVNLKQTGKKLHTRKKHSGYAKDTENILSI